MRILTSKLKTKTMDEIKKLIKYSEDLEIESPDESAYWHLQKLRKKMKQALNITDVNNSVICPCCDGLGQCSDIDNEMGACLTCGGSGKL